MQFALIYSYDPTVAGPTDAEVQDWIDLDTAFTEAGINVHEAGFHPIEEDIDVTVRNGETSQEAAPSFDPTVAGCYIIDVPDIQTAADYAAKIPTASYGSVQVRQVVDFSQYE